MICLHIEFKVGASFLSFPQGQHEGKTPAPLITLLGSFRLDFGARQQSRSIVLVEVLHVCVLTAAV